MRTTAARAREWASSNRKGEWRSWLSQSAGGGGEVGIARVFNVTTAGYAPPLARPQGKGRKKNAYKAGSGRGADIEAFNAGGFDVVHDPGRGAGSN